MKFLPCPFCGGADIRCDKHRCDDYRREEKFVWSMCCYQCGATFPNRYRKELLIEAWNRRAAPPAEQLVTNDRPDPELDHTLSAVNDALNGEN